MITVIADQPAPPGWKILWDEARKKVQGKKIPDAAQLYRQLLALKPNIEAANWEYCKVLIKTGDFSSAAVVILPLLEKDPTRLDYLLTAGMISLRMEDYSAAFKQYGKVYEVDPGGIHSTVALKGMIESLKGAGNIGVALPLLEQLQSRQSNNRQLLYEIAADAEQLGKNEKARSYYKKILGSGPISQIDERIIFDAAGFFEKLNYQEDSVPLWQEYIRRNPEYLLFYKKLADYFMGKNDSKSALPYFHFLADNTEDNSQLLARIAEIYLYQVNRPDRALKFYEMYMKKNPADRKVLAEISNIQSTLANDFLSIVENDGAVQLWGDLEKVTPNRPAIYLKMANLLGQKGKLPEQFEVLQILHDFRPQDDTITYRIVNNLRKRKEYAAALNYLNNVSPVHNKSKRYFLLKGNIEELQGKEVAALYSFISGLKADSDDFDLRRICISRAGALGLIKELGELFEEIPRNSHRKITIDFIINYFDQLAYNSLFTRLDRQYDHFLAVFKNDTVTRFKLQLHQAGTRRLCGKPKKAEALYRKLLNSHISDGEVLSLLAGNAIDDNKVDTARVWYKALSDIIESYSGSRAAEKADLVRKKTLLDARFMLAAGDSQGAAYSIDQLKKSFKTGTENRSSARVVSLLEQELCWLYIEKEEFSEYRSLAKELTKGDRFIPDISAIENILKIKPAEKAVENINQPSLFIGKRPVMSRFIQVAQVEIKHGEYDSADRHLHAVLKRSSHSL
ncbi:MAG: hypothetical protein JRC87_10970, partial [Deltaproteobacteria bacterium]|nr:hypothetical protein [Deltaproteobacteria bacterium]